MNWKIVIGVIVFILVVWMVVIILMPHPKILSVKPEALVYGKVVPEFVITMNKTLYDKFLSVIGNQKIYLSISGDKSMNASQDIEATMSSIKKDSKIIYQLATDKEYALPVKAAGTSSVLYGQIFADILGGPESPVFVLGQMQE